VLIEQRPSDDSEVAALVVDQQIELRARDGEIDGRVHPADPAARYLVAVIGGEAVACGALQTMDIDTAELKRIYVRPAYRGRGIARRVLAALEDFARSRGHVVVRLEAGVFLTEAIGLFLSCGYRPVERFGAYLRNEASRCYEKRLAGDERAIRVVRRPAADPAVANLMAEAVDELAGRYGDEDGDWQVSSSARFMLAMVDGVPAGCGAIVPLDDQTVELKRMYVRPAYRGNGLARRVLTALEDLAAGAHYPVVRLETGTRQAEAIALYESSGYRPIPLYGRYVGNPFSVCYEKLVIGPEVVAQELAEG